MLSAVNHAINVIKRYKIHILLFLLASFVYLPMKYTIEGWDQYQYFFGAKSILMNHVYLVDNKPPPYPMMCSLLIAPFLYFFGITDQSAVYPCAILGALTVVVLYAFTKYLTNMRAALFASIFFTFSLHWLLSTTIRSDVPALFFILLGIFSGVKYIDTEKRFFIYFFYIAAGFACLFRYPSALIFVIMFLYILLSKNYRVFKNKDVWLGLLVFFVVMSPQLIYNHIYFGSAFTTGYGFSSAPAYGASHFTTPKLPLMLLTQNIGLIIFGFGTAIFPFFVYGMWDLFKKGNHDKRWLIISWIAVPFFIFSFYFYYDGRLLYPVLPALLITAGHGFSRMCTKIGVDSADNNGSNLAIKKAFVILIVIVLLVTTAFFGFNNIQKRTDKGELMINTSVWIRENTNESDIILSDTWNILVREYYAQRKIYSLTLSHDELKELISTGKDVYLVINEEVKQLAQMGLYNQKSITDMSDTIQWLNETFGLIPLKTFEIDSSNQPWTSKIIYSIGTKTKVLVPYKERRDVYLVKKGEI
ncbi:MAG: glycosyltransferase family 39 protein [Halobacteriota archaeon]